MTLPSTPPRNKHLLINYTYFPFFGLYSHSRGQTRFGKPQLVMLVKNQVRKISLKASGSPLITKLITSDENTSK